MPRFRVVARADTKSLRGPAVTRPMTAPAKMAKLVKPKLKLAVGCESLRGGADRKTRNHTYYLGTEFIRGCSEDLTLRQVKGQETAATPTCNEG
jgi:hypothetical protein